MKTNRQLAEAVYIAMASRLLGAPSDVIKSAARASIELANAFDDAFDAAEAEEKKIDDAQICACGCTKAFHLYGNSEPRDCDACGMCEAFRLAPEKALCGPR